MKLLFFSFFLSLTALAEVNIGSKLTANKFNNSTFMVGDIKQSLLSLEKFQQYAGDCWVKMEGQDISGSDYATIMEKTHLPDARGRFLRSIGGSRAPLLAETQEDAFQNITGDFVTRDDNSSAYYVRIKDSNGAFYTENVKGNMFNSVGSTSNQTAPGKVKFDASRVARTANETRPQNIGVNFFVKINHNCN